MPAESSSDMFAILAQAVSRMAASRYIHLNISVL